MSSPLRGRVCGWACAMLVVAALTAAAADTGLIFRLESVRTGAAYGPFELLDNTRLQVEDGACIMRVAGNRTLRFKSIETGADDGPYDFELGRIVLINKVPYTIVEIEPVEIPVPPEIEEDEPAAPPAKPAPPKPAEVQKPAPVATPPKPAAPKPAPARTEPAATTPKPPAKPPPPKPLPPKPVAPKPAPAAQEDARRQPRAQAPKKPARSEPLWEPVTWEDIARDLSLGGDLTLFEETQYDRSVQGVAGSDEISVNRRYLTVFARKGIAGGRLSFLIDGDWDGEIASEEAGFDGGWIHEGSGWWLAFDVQPILWQSGDWRVDLAADLTWRQEDYTLSYRVWHEGPPVVMEVPGTNGAGTAVVRTREAETLDTDISLTEYVLRIGPLLRYSTADWGAWGGLKLRLLDSPDVSGGITADAGRLGVELDSVQPLEIVGGASKNLLGLEAFADIQAGGSVALRLGALWRF